MKDSVGDFNGRRRRGGCIECAECGQEFMPDDPDCPVCLECLMEIGERADAQSEAEALSICGECGAPLGVGERYLCAECRCEMHGGLY